MNTEMFFDNFDLLAEAPNGVPKLRELILQLAVKGKLVPQDPNDEPASVLFDKALKEKSKKRLLRLEEISTHLPNGWVMVKMGDIVDHRLGKMLDKNKNKGNLYPYLRNTNVQWLRFDLGDIKEMRFEPDELEEYEIRIGDLLICEGGEPGRCAIWGGELDRVMFQKAIHRVRPLANIDSWFLAYRLLADAMSGYLEQHFTGATIKHFTGQELARYSFPLPPPREQKRIVAKVNELMKLCDEMEQRQQKKREGRIHLNNSALEHLLAASTPEEFKTHWQRICDNFDLLYDTPQTIAKLRQSIRQLAIQGKLVKQVPSDDCGEYLLERIKAKKELLMKEKRFKKNVPQSPIKPEEIPFEIPTNWSWCRLGTILNVKSSKRVFASDYQLEGIPFYRSMEIGLLGEGKNITEELFISEEKYNKIKREFGVPKLGDILLACIGGSIGNTWVVDDRKFYYKDGNLVQIESIPEIDTSFLLSYLKCDFFINSAMARVSGSAYNALTIIKINHSLFPLPPLEEQKRIVAKVDQLMKLCDALEAKLNQAQSLSECLTASMVNHIYSTAAENTTASAALPV